jgi:tRNA threonylcarbamoyladenosine modification (KEOPS) complex  Pcc1 subunit
MGVDDSGPKVRCSLRLGFSSEAEARKILDAVELDNQGYVDTKVDGSSILADIKATSLNSLLHTLDDFLSCTSVAEKVISKKP